METWKSQKGYGKSWNFTNPCCCCCFFVGIPIYYFDPQLTMWLTCLNLTDVSCTFCNKEVSRIQGTHQVQGAVLVMNTFNLSAESRECFACSSGIFSL